MVLTLAPFVSRWILMPAKGAAQGPVIFIVQNLWLSSHFFASSALTFGHVAMMDGEHKGNRLGAEALQRWKFLAAVGMTCIAHEAIDGSHHFRRLCTAFWDACCPFPQGHLDFAYCGLFSRYFQKCHGCQLRSVSVVSL